MLRRRIAIGAVFSALVGAIDWIGRATLPDAFGITLRTGSLAATLASWILSLPASVYASIAIVLGLLWCFWSRLLNRPAEDIPVASSVSATSTGDSAVTNAFVGNNNTVNINVAQTQAVEETAEVKAHALVGKIFNDRSIGTFPNDDDGGWHTKCLLLLYFVNRGPSTILSNLEFTVRHRDGRAVQMGWVINQTPVPKSQDEAVPFRSMAYAAQNALPQGGALNVYAYCALKGVAYAEVDRGSWQVSFEDAHGNRYVARPTSGMIASTH